MLIHKINVKLRENKRAADIHIYAAAQDVECKDQVIMMSLLIEELSKRQIREREWQLYLRRDEKGGKSF